MSEVNELVRELLEVEEKIRALRIQKKEVEDELLNLDPAFSVEVSPQLKVYGSTEKKYQVETEKVCDAYSIPDEFRRILGSAWYKIGELKRIDTLKDTWSQIDTGKVVIKRLNPEMLNVKSEDAA